MALIGKHNITNAAPKSDIYIVWPINLTYWDTDSDIAVRNANGNHLFVGTMNDIRNCIKDYKALISRSDSEIHTFLKINSSKYNVEEIQKFISRTYSADLITEIIVEFDADVYTVAEFKKML